MKKTTAATTTPDDYPFEIRPLGHDEGGGYLVSYPDFNTCVSDGETVQEAIANGRQALAGMIEALQAWGQPVPVPGSGGVASGKFVTRVPKSLHAALTARAKMEGVSLNAMVLTLIAQGIGRTRQPAVN
jgi:antitoxin HicB